MPLIEVVSASRFAEREFWASAPLGISLRRLSSANLPIAASIAFSNTLGLPQVFNARIAAGNTATLLVFIHDDVWIDDFFFAERVAEGLAVFDVIGVAGCRRRQQRQRAWRHVGAAAVAEDTAQLSGRIGHGKHPFGRVSSFGPAPAECELLDGVFLATRLSALLDRGIRFDPRFAFHFYDLDFCRAARAGGLRLGTWPICLTHQSTGTAFETPEWLSACEQYFRKWVD